MGGARFKLGRHGRRWGKSTAAFTAALTGHGPGWPEEPRFKGVAQGFDVYWIPPDFSQAGTLWRTEVLPRLSGIAGVKVNNSDYSATFPNGAAFRLWSAENVRAIRGSGKRLGGVVLEEAAHWPCGSAWVREVRPALMDNRGWAWFISSTNSGSDGETDDRGNKITPSFFNRQCQEVLDGTAGDDWQETHGDARDNPKIHPDEFADMVKGYGNRHPSALQEEVYAALLTEGVGKAFPEWRNAVHVGAFHADETLRNDWVWYAGLDWGYEADGCYVLFAVNPKGRVHVRWDYAFNHATPDKVVAGIVDGHRKKGFPFPKQVGCDSGMLQRGGVRTVYEAFLEAWLDRLGREAKDSPIVPVSKSGLHGKHHRASRKLLIHELLAWDQAVPVEQVQPWQQPKMTFHPDAKACIKTIPGLLQSPVNPEDVDTTGDDHPYDGLGYGLWLRPKGLPMPEPTPERGRQQVDADGIPLRGPFRASAIPEAPDRRYGVRHRRQGLKETG